MTIVAVTGNHPRHVYLVKQLHDAGILSGWVVEEREAFMPAPPSDCVGHIRDLFVTHFRMREASEHAFFGSGQNMPTGPVPIHKVTATTLNSQATLEFIDKRAPRIVLSYGCHKLMPNLIDSTDAAFWNVHGGLSPAYRGVTTHFWPSYFLEPQMTGMTLHTTTDAIDGGAIIHQTAGSMQKGDKLHDLACRTVQEFANGLPVFMSKVLQSDGLPSGVPQKHTGKIWVASDWRPEHLSLVYDHYGDAIVDMVLNGEIKGRNPSLISCLQ